MYLKNLLIILQAIVPNKKVIMKMLSVHHHQYQNNISTFFSKESISHLTKTNDMVYVMNGFARRGIYGLADMVRDIYLEDTRS
jgi:hypothetical protein